MATSASSRHQAYMMADTQEHHAQQAPEVVNQSYPEALTNGHYQYQQYPKPEGTGHGSYGGPYSTHSASQLDQVSPRPYHSTPAAGVGSSASGDRRKGGICGCGVLVTILCAIIALLLAAVVGLAAGTGIEANRANTAEDRLAHATASAAATATVTATSAAGATSTSWASIDQNCSGNPDGVTGTTYNVFSLYGNASFTIKCNKDALGDPLLSIFVPDFNSCMDSCAAYTSSISAHFGSNNTNSTCDGVSFIPLWTNKTAALVGGAPGNCYLKPTQTGEPNTPNIGTECHAGILNSS